MQRLLNDGSKLLSGRAFVVRSTTPGAPVELTLSPQNEILQDFKIFAQAAAGSILSDDLGFKILVNKKQVFPAMGSNESGAGFVGPSSGWSAIPTAFMLESGELNHVMDGSPYNVTFQFYNADSGVDANIFLWLRVTPKIDLPTAPIQDDAKEKKS